MGSVSEQDRQAEEEGGEEEPLRLRRRACWPEPTKKATGGFIDDLQIAVVRCEQEKNHHQGQRHDGQARGIVVQLVGSPKPIRNPHAQQMQE